MKKNNVLFLFFFICNTNQLNAYISVLFSPEDNPSEKLITLIRSAKKQIYAAVYMITDKKIANELINAKIERNVDVQIITDKITIDSRLGRGNYLTDHDINVFMFSGDPIANKLKEKNNYINSIMHHKFVIIDKVVWAGSFNWTQSANQFNREDIIITDESGPRKKYLARFQTLKEQCVPVLQKKQTVKLEHKSNTLFVYATIKNIVNTIFNYYKKA